MSRIQGRPFIELVIGTLNEEKKKKLLNLVNGTDEQPAFRSLINSSNYITDADKNDVSHIVLETWHKTFTGYLIYNNTYCVLISYVRNTQDLNLLSINLTNQTYTTIRQSLTILELRYVLNDVSEHITPGDIDSGDAPKGQVLTADGDSGASWENRVAYLNLESESGNLTNAQIEVAEQDNVIITLDGQFYYKNSQSDEAIVFKAPAKVVDDDTIAEKVVIDLSDNTYSYSYEVVSAGSSFDPVYDDELDDASTNAVQNKVIYEELEQYAKKDGNYPTLTSGLADNLNTNIVDNDVNAYIFRPTGGLDTESGNNCKEKAIVGGSLGFNQLCNRTTPYTKTGGDTIYSSVGIEFSIPQGHKVLFLVHQDMTISECSRNTLMAYYGTSVTKQSEVPNRNLQAGTYHWIFNTTGTLTHIGYWLQDYGEGDASYSNFQVFDLTAMFGPTIADYIYSLETATAGAGVAWFKRYFNKPYYPYTAIGGLTHVQTRGKKAVGFNLLDLEHYKYMSSSAVSSCSTTKSDITITSDGTNTDVFVGGEVSSPSLNPSRTLLIPVEPNTVYNLSLTTPDGNSGDAYSMYIVFVDANYNFLNNYQMNFGINHNARVNVQKTSPANSAFAFIRFGIVQANAVVKTYVFKNVNFNFHYDGERDGEYEEYREEIYENDAVELIGIPQIDAQGNLYFDGDKYLPDGTVVENYLVVVFDGSDDETITDYGSYQRYRLGAIQNFTAGDSSVAAKIFCNRLWTTSKNSIYSDDFAIASGDVGSHDFVIRLDSSFDTVEKVKTWLSNNPLTIIYKVDEPIEDSATPYPETQWCDNWGIEERLPPLSDTRPCEIPVGHDTDYPLDLKSKLEIMPNSPSSDGDYVLHAESGTNTYVALSSWLSDNGYVKQVDLSSEITDVAGLTYDIKKAYKQGNMVFITIRAKNETGNTISDGATVFTFSQSLSPSISLYLVCRIGTNVSTCYVNSNGNVSLQSSLANDGYLIATLAYVVE